MDEDYKRIIDRAIRMREKKQQLYADSWKNMSIEENFIFIKNKFERLKMLINKNITSNEIETAEDTLLDLINYSAFLVYNLNKTEQQK